MYSKFLKSLNKTSKSLDQRKSLSKIIFFFINYIFYKILNSILFIFIISSDL